MIPRAFSLAVHETCAAVLAVTSFWSAAPALADPVDGAAGVAERAAGVDIVILGEIHDNPAHHVLQAAAIDLIDPAAIVFEMLGPEEASRVTPELAGDRDALAAALDWADSGWPDFAMYYPLLANASAVPIFGAEVPRDAAQRAFAEGAAAVFAGDAEGFGLTEALDEDQQAAREAAQLAAHCDALPADILPGFVEAQRLRDATLAASALEALEAHGAPVVIVTGNGHARRDWGVPSVLETAAPDVEVLSLGQFEAAPGAEPPYDLWAVAAPVERPDPCLAFR
jgi:uncharacterized iron-regulated protein